MEKEDLKLSDYILYGKERSKVNLHKFVLKEIGMSCPHCKTQLPMIGYRQTRKCPICSLNLYRVGNRLTVSEG